MRRRLNLLLTLLFLFLLLLCGTGAFFTDQQQARLRAGAASMGLSVSEPEYDTMPTTVERNSALRIRFQVRNESSVPVYLSEQVKLYVNGTEENTKLQLERTGPAEASEGTGLRFAAGEQKVLSYSLSFPGVESLPEGVLAVKGELLFQAVTSADGRSGFTYGPVTGIIDLTKGELQIPARSREILLSEVVEEGSHPLEEVRWYRASDTDSTATLGTARTWSALDVSTALTLQRDAPLYVRYELLATGGIVRSPVYEIRLSSGEIQAKSYDYFDGKEVRADITISKEAT